jgi:hypothetical protein
MGSAAGTFGNYKADYRHFSSDDPANYGFVGVQQAQSPAVKMVRARREIDNAFSTYDDNFFNDRAQSYIDYAMPKLAESFRGQRNQLGFGLANSGLTGSGAAGVAKSQQNRGEGEQKLAVADTALSQSQALRQQIDQYKTQLYQQLYAGARPGQVVAQAGQMASRFPMQSTMAPFTQLAAGYGNVIGATDWSKIFGGSGGGASYTAPATGTGSSYWPNE